MIIDADLLAKGIGMLNEYLNAGEVTVNFTKQDGSLRTMRCTRRMDMIPFDKQPKPKLPTDIVEAHDSQLFKVYDLEKQDWRSFRYTTVKTISTDDNTRV